MGSVNDRNSEDLIDAKDEVEVVRIYRRTVQNDLNDLDNHDGVVTHL